MQRLRMILEMIRFSHTVFALPFALLSAVMAWRLNASEDPPRAWSWLELAGIVLCMVFARSAAMAFNRLADRGFDAENPRTRARHIPDGQLSVASVTLFAVLCAGGFVASTLLFLPNRLPIYLALPVLAFLLAYSYTKRFTALAHFWLGAALMLAPVAAWIAIRGEVVAAPLVLGGAVLLWAAGFDMIYACPGHRLRSPARTAQRAGSTRRRRLASSGCGLSSGHDCPALSVASGLSATGWHLPVGHFGGGAAFDLRTLAGPARRPERVNVAFFNVNAVISIGLFCDRLARFADLNLTDGCWGGGNRRLPAPARLLD